MKTTFSQQQKKGFTLIELLVVIVILGSLAAVSYPLITSFMEKGDITKAKKTCDDLISGIKTYHQENNIELSDVELNRRIKTYLTAIEANEKLKQMNEHIINNGFGLPRLLAENLFYLGGDLLWSKG